MHEELMKDHEAEENFHCSYDLYRNVISEMNISFAKLGHEECERCEKYNLHKQDHGQIDELLCPECNEWKDHKKKYTEAREAYEKSIDKDNLDSYRPSGTVVYTMDLQKVIMLPHIEQFKEAVFSRRIVLFNESFVPVGEKPTMDPFACIWHEGISGRKKEDIASALNSFIMHKRDAKKIHIWMDNCAAQNKNWALFSYLTGLVNSNDIEANEIVLNYLETGHTFMSADHFHHQVNKQIKSKGKMYDFEDFKDAVKASNSGKVTVKSMEHQDFFTEFNYSSQYKIMHKVPRPYLSEMVHVLFQRGSFDMFYRKSFSGEVFQLSFLKAGFTKKREVPKPNTRTSPRGVNKEKKQDIIKTLVPLMPPNRHGFWVDLAVSEEPDLITEHDID
ncbi:uncharacterized protein LOC124370764 [Homalodisca vitripennis]|uniref:uncharacterized protein LOC124370764 n=1 Tax=Homalodisca vitripennis TaxID=197043 RepID=UPI001EEC00A2|nr:uncharacterized protein LOC124370764 [Homalodisca vitripennis]